MPNGSILIIGAGPGLGAALAETFAAAGYPVGLFGRDRAQLDTQAHALTSAGHPAGAYRADVTDREQFSAATSRAAGELGRPEGLVYNAVLPTQEQPSDLTADRLAQSLAVNVGGAVTAVNAVLPLLSPGGSILLTGGGFALHPLPALTALSIGKAALRAYAYTLYEEQLARGVHASTVTIAGVLTPGDPRFDQRTVAARFLEVHQAATPDWTAEVVHQ